MMVLINVFENGDGVTIIHVGLSKKFELSGILKWLNKYSKQFSFIDKTTNNRIKNFLNICVLNLV